MAKLTLQPEGVFSDHIDELGPFEEIEIVIENSDGDKRRSFDILEVIQALRQYEWGRRG